MSNRNVEMLTALLTRITGDGARVSAGTEWLACRLAAEGVLVPEALTVEELERLADIGDSMIPQGAVPEIRYALERIAKGET